MLLILGRDEKTGKLFGPNLETVRSTHRIDPDPTNYDTTDFPRKGRRQCGKRDRPQFRGVCNDDRCSNP